MTEQIREKVLQSLEDFVYNNFILKDGRKLKLTSYQVEIIKAGLERNKTKYVILAATRSGKSTAVAVLAILAAIVYSGEEVCLIAPTWKQSVEGLFTEIRGFVERNGKLRKLVRQIKQGQVIFKNNSKIYCLTAAGEAESALGFGASVLIVDEAGSIETDILKQKILRMAVSERDRKNLLFIIGTPHNLDSYLFEAWNSGEFEKYRITWKDACREGIMDRSEVEFIRKQLSEDEFAVWYEAEWRQLSDDMFFDSEAIKKASVIERKSYSYADLEAFEICLGFDVGRFGKSKSVVAAVGRLRGDDSDKLYMLDYRSVSKKGIDWQIGWVSDLVKKFKPIKLIVDETGIGGGAMDLLREKLADQIEVIPFSFARRKERVELYDNLKFLIEEGGLLLLNDTRLRENFNAFKIKYRSDGIKDVEKRQDVESDIVDALALACWGFKSGWKAEFWDVSIDELVNIGVSR
ncbi:hypothetical protein DRO97_02505 [Archaeoglobales archaeon]|nr:MAG: hypothetical protein DRO97_02505 [Archaeoglobales archaeon]